MTLVIYEGPNSSASFVADGQTFIAARGVAIDVPADVLGSLPSGWAVDENTLSVGNVASDYAAGKIVTVAAELPLAVPFATNVTPPTRATVTFTGGTYRIPHVAIFSGHSIQLLYWNGYNNNGVETANPWSITVAAGIEYPSGATPFPVTFGGANSVVIPPGSWAASDSVSIDVVAGDTWFERSFVQTPAQSEQYGVGKIAEDATYTTNQTVGTSPVDTTKATTSMSSAVGNSMFGAAAVFAIPNLTAGAARSKQTLVGILGDSIATGVGDNPADKGFILRGLNSQYGYYRASMQSDRASFFAANAGRQRGLPLRRCSNFICNYGRNDLSNGDSLATIQANLVKAWNYCVNRGAQAIFQTTITPKSSSTDNWLTLGNQTTSTDNAVRVNLNNWLRAGAPMVAGAAVAIGTGGAVTCAYTDSNGTVTPGTGGHPLTGVWEVADLVESARDSGKWAVTGARAVTDAAMTSGTSVVASATANFTNADVGTAIFVAGAATGPATLTATLLSVQSATSATVGWGVTGSGQKTAANTVSAAAATIGAQTQDGLHPSNHPALSTAIRTSQFVAA